MIPIAMNEIRIVMPVRYTESITPCTSSALGYVNLCRLCAWLRAVCTQLLGSHWTEVCPVKNYLLMSLIDYSTQSFWKMRIKN